MAVKVKDFIAKRFKREDSDTALKSEQIEYYTYMINKMKDLGRYVGIDVENFEEDFYMGDDSIGQFKDFYSTTSLYSYKKDGSSFELIRYVTNPNEDILISGAFTCKIDLIDQTFEYHSFEKPRYLRYEVNIIHQKMSGILPYHIFSLNTTDNITRGVILKDFEKEFLSNNVVEEIHDVIENSRNTKEYVYDQTSFMWEVKYSIEDLYKDLEYQYKDAPEFYTKLITLPLENAKQLVISNPSLVKSVDRIIELLELIHYKKQYIEFQNTNDLTRTQKK